MTTIDISGDDRVQKFLRLIQGLDESRTIRTALGERGAQLVRENFYEKDKTPNRLNGKRTHFWRQAGDATGYDLHPEGATVFTTKLGVRQRLEGGVITPKNAKWLTVPLTAEAHGVRAREFPDLDFAGGFLVDDEGRAHYVLKKRVVQEADPTVQPSDKEMRELAVVVTLENAEELLKRR